MGANAGKQASSFSFFKNLPGAFRSVAALLVGQSRSIRFVLLGYFLTIIFILFLSLGLFGPWMYSRRLQSEMESFAVQTLAQVGENVDLRIREIEKLSSQIALDREAERFFSTPGDGTALEALAARLESFPLSHPEITGIALVNSRGELLSRTHERVTRDSLLYEFWYAQAVFSSARASLFPRPVGRNIRRIDGADEGHVVSVVTPVAGSRDGAALGVVLIDASLDEIGSSFASTRLGQSGFVFILDPSDQIVYAPTNPVVYRINPSWLEAGTVSTIRAIGGKPYQIISRKSSSTDWRTVGVFPLADMRRSADWLRSFAVLAALGTALLAFFISLIFSDSIAKPVGRLTELMAMVEEGDLTVRCRDRRKDELGRLGTGFNAMVEKIGELIAMVYQDQKNLRDAELRILQAQIKPHFLYNTLDTIQWMAREHGAADVATLVSALTKLFRLGLSGGHEIIAVRDELDHVRSYLTIQQARYEDAFDYRIDVEEALLSQGILKVVLQPLVENAIYHGIKERRGKGSILIRGRSEGDALEFRVRDDGVGIGRERLDALNALLAEPSALPTSLPAGNGRAESGFALLNVNARIKLSAGAGYGLRLESEEGRWTEVVLRMPSMETGRNGS